MIEDIPLARIAADPRYRTLVARRNRFTRWLSGVMLAAYLGFLLLVAFLSLLWKDCTTRGAVAGGTTVLLVAWSGARFSLTL